jgi:uncharacterized membrane protein YsdA (DUF1294 family)
MAQKIPKTNNNVIPVKTGIQSVEHCIKHKVKRKTFVSKYQVKVVVNLLALPFPFSRE